MGVLPFVGVTCDVSIGMEDSFGQSSSITVPIMESSTDVVSSGMAAELECLVSEDEGPGREQSLLQAPTTRTSVVVGVAPLTCSGGAVPVDGVRCDVDYPELCLTCRSFNWLTEGANEGKDSVGYHFEFPILQEAFRDLRSAPGVDRHVRITIHVPHPRQLVVHVLFQVLNNTQAVDPEEVDSQCSCHVDRVQDRLRELGGVNPALVRRQLLLGRPMGLVLAPHVAKRYVPPTHGRIGLYNAQAVGIRAVDESGREGCTSNGIGSDCMARGMVAYALIDARLRLCQRVRPSYMRNENSSPDPSCRRIAYLQDQSYATGIKYIARHEPAVVCSTKV